MPLGDRQAAESPKPWQGAGQHGLSQALDRCASLPRAAHFLEEDTVPQKALSALPRALAVDGGLKPKRWPWTGQGRRGGMRCLSAQPPHPSSIFLGLLAPPPAFSRLAILSLTRSCLQRRRGRVAFLRLRGAAPAPAGPALTASASIDGHGHRAAAF